MEGCPAGAPGCWAGTAGGAAGAAGFFWVVCLVLSRTVLPTPELRVASTDSVREVIMKTTAEMVVALESRVADPRGPKAV